MRFVSKPNVNFLVDVQWMHSWFQVGHGYVTCASIYCGPDVDFGNGPCLWIDNLDDAEVLEFLAIDVELTILIESIEIQKYLNKLSISTTNYSAWQYFRVFLIPLAHFGPVKI